MDEALERVKSTAGGPSGLAEKLGDITPQAISQWKRVPAERVLDVERVTGISRHDLRPDLSRIFVTLAPPKQEAAA